LYKRFEDKRLKAEDLDDYNNIQKYLLDDTTLGKTKKPILWIHVPYEYNSRNWLSFGSRSSFELNQPYLYLTTKSIIKHCSDSFHICLIDDKSFGKLLPGWNVQMDRISHPISDKMRTLALAKIIYKYGGMLVPISFLCMRDLSGLYKKVEGNGQLLICENNDRNITSTSFKYYPDLQFMAAHRETGIVRDLINFMEGAISRDFTDESTFLGQFDKWCVEKSNTGKILLIDGVEVGTKTIDDEPIKVENLLSSHYMKLYDKTYGIWIPADEILRRRHYEWFARLSAKQVLESNTIIGKYMILANIPSKKEGMLVEAKPKPNWVSFWKTPLGEPYWGLKPNFLGDNILKTPYPTN
jgi:hypothetical protein